MKNSIIERARALAAHKVILFGLALCAMAFYSLPIRALDEVLIDSIYYKLNDKDKTASVQHYAKVSHENEHGDWEYYPDPRPVITYTGKSSKLVIPSQVKHGGKTYTVTRIKCICQESRICWDGNNYKQGTAIEEVVLPGTITMIDEFAFGYLGYLKRLNLPANLDSLPDMTLVGIFDYPWYLEYYQCNSDCSNLGQRDIDLDHLIIESPLVLKKYSQLYNYMLEHKLNKKDRLDALQTEILIDTVTLLGNGGDSIFSHTFHDWIGLKAVNLPKSNTQFIGVHAFDSCVNLQSINLAEVKVLKRVNDYAFKDCKKLKNGDLPESVTNIGTGVFKGCMSLNHASLPSNFAWVPQEMYEGCATSSWLTITLSDNVTRIMPSAFKNCTLEKMILPSKIEIIEEHAFQSVKIPTFQGVSDNKNLVLPKSLAVLGDYAFNGSAFTALTVNSEFSAVGQSVFSLSKIETVTINNGSIISRPEVSSALGLFGAAVKKYTINDCNAIPANFFKGCDNVEEIDITKAHVLSIGESAFMNCTGLKYFDTDDATTLGQYAFKSCTSLKDVDLREITSIPEHAFEACLALKNIYLGKAQGIASNAFDGCNAIAAFSAYDATYFNTEGGILYNSDKTMLYLFPRASENFALDDYELPETVSRIRSDAFDYCTHLHSITSKATTPPVIEAKNSVTQLFTAGIDRQIKIYVPEGSIQAYKNAWGTNHCEYLPIQSGTCTADGISYEFYGNLSATVVNGATPYSGDVVIPATFEYGGKTYQVTAIGDDAFDNCTGLTSISLPEGLLTIGDAFGGCVGLTTLTLPSTLTSLGKYAFYACTGLQEIICKAVNPPTCNSQGGIISFLEVPKTTPLWVPRGSVSLYQEANGWKKFKDNTYAFAATCADVNTIDGNSKAFLKPVSVAFVSGRYVYIQDETGTTMLYLNAADEAIYKGAKIDGIEGKTILYSGLPEVKPSNNVSDWTITADGDEPSMKTIIEVPTYNEINQFVRIEGASLDAEFTASKSTEVSLTMLNGNIILRNQFRLEYSFSAEKRYDILAAVAINNDVMKLYFIKVLSEYDKPQGLEDVQSDKVQCTKVLRNGQVLILRGDKMYTITGQEVK